MINRLIAVKRAGEPFRLQSSPHRSNSKRLVLGKFLRNRRRNGKPIDNPHSRNRAARMAPAGRPTWEIYANILCQTGLWIRVGAWQGGSGMILRWLVAELFDPGLKDEKNGLNLQRTYRTNVSSLRNFREIADAIGPVDSNKGAQSAHLALEVLHQILVAITVERQRKFLPAILA